MPPNIALYNFVPHYCPHCGKEIKISSVPDAWMDYTGQASHTCPACNTKYQFVRNADLLLRTSKDAGGYLNEWVKREAV